MKRLFMACAVLLATVPLRAQQTDSTIFRTFLENKEYDLTMRINFYEQDVIIPWQDILGPLPGYLNKNGSSYCWIVNDASISGRRATLEMVNDAGSDDLVATLEQTNDTTYVLHHEKGAAMKVPNKGKWQKLPSTLTFIRRKATK